MKTVSFAAAAFIALLVVPVAASAAGKSTSGSTYRAPASSSSPISPQMRQTVGDMRGVIKTYNRQYIESTTRSTLGSGHTVTSRDRPANSPLASSAHNRGAIDIAVPQARIHQDARALSRNLGPHYQAIVEQKTRTGDLHTTYNNGVQTPRPHLEPGRATNTHIHIQPRRGFEVRALPAAPTQPWLR